MADLSEYEQLRLRNIARNKEVMKALGLDDFDFDAHRKQAPKPRAEEGEPAPKRKRELRGSPVRRSLRVAGVSACETSLNLPDDLDGEEVSGREARAQALKGSEEDHALAEAEHLRWAGKQGKITIVGTASYKHTLMRVRTMSEEALARRIKTIERAAGKVGSCRKCPWPQQYSALDHNMLLSSPPTIHTARGGKNAALRARALPRGLRRPCRERRRLSAAAHRCSWGPGRG